MNTRTRLTAIALGLMLAGIAPAHAVTETQTLSTQSNTMDELATSQGGSTVTSRFASSFATFAGSQQNAEAILTGLRNGTPITLGGTATGGVTIAPSTKPMGYGSAFISMSLAQAQLAQYGITRPTAQQLQAALTGGTITVNNGATTATTGSTTNTVQLQGVLTQRASGMGWGQIANGMGVKLGKVISSIKTENHRLATTHHDDADEPHEIDRDKAAKRVTTASGNSKGYYDDDLSHTKGRRSGVTTAAGTAAAAGSTGKASASGITTAAGSTGGTYRRDGDHHRAYGSGIVTAAGGSFVYGSGSRSSGYEHGAGTVNAAGASVSGGITRAEGGHGESGSHGKKD